MLVHAFLSYRLLSNAKSADAHPEQPAHFRQLSSCVRSATCNLLKNGHTWLWNRLLFQMFSIVCCADFRLPLPGTGLFGRPKTGPFPPPSFPQLQGLYRARTAGGHAGRGRSAQGTGGQGRQVRQGWAVGHAAPRLREIQRVGSLAQRFAMKCLELLEICRVGWWGSCDDLEEMW